MLFFFFSSRRRHTRCLSDWSSDVCSSDLIREPDGSRGATEPIGKHTSERDPSNDVAGAVQIRVETLGPAELIVREPMPEGASGAGPHVQVDVPQVKGGIGRGHAYGGRRRG